jgi:hypothetical protein
MPYNNFCLNKYIVSYYKMFSLELIFDWYRWKPKRILFVCQYNWIRNSTKGGLYGLNTFCAPLLGVIMAGRARTSPRCRRGALPSKGRCLLKIIIKYNKSLTDVRREGEGETGEVRLKGGRPALPEGIKGFIPLPPFPRLYLITEAYPSMKKGIRE